MKRYPTPAVVVAALAWCLSAPAFGDSDGYYCVGPSYLAYQLSFSAPVSRHTLFIVPLPPEGDEISISSIALPEFQVHGLQLYRAVCVGPGVGASLRSDARRAATSRASPRGRVAERLRPEPAPRAQRTTPRGATDDDAPLALRRGDPAPDSRAPCLGGVDVGSRRPGAVSGLSATVLPGSWRGEATWT